MDGEALIGNPLGWVQLQIAGGWRRLGVLAGAFAGAIILFSVLIYRGARNEGVTLAQFAGGALAVITVVQAGILIFLSTSAIHRAIRRDFTTDMITSHRLTAMSGPSAILGYLTGPTAQAIALGLVAWLCATVFAILSQPVPRTAVLAPTLLLVAMLCMALMCWTFAVLAGLCTRGRIGIQSILVVLAIFATGHVIQFVPGLGILLAAGTIERMVSSATIGLHNETIVISMVAQLLLAAIFFLAASRKFARNDVPAFNMPLALAALALATLLSVVGLAYLPQSSLRILAGGNRLDELKAQLVASIVGIALVAMLPTAVAARTSADWARRARTNPRFTGARPGPYWLAPLISLLLVVDIAVVLLIPKRSFILANSTHEIYWRVGHCGLALLLTLLTVAGLLRFLYHRRLSAFFGLIIFLVFFWAMPAFIDLSAESILDRPPNAPRGLLFAVTPVGLWIAEVYKIDAPIAAGLIVQAGIAAAAILLAGRTKRE